MHRYAAFLRGMNVGGHRITNDELRAHVEELGFGDVASFRASGNLIFSAHEDHAPDAISERLEAGLLAALGYAVPVFVRTAADVRAIAAHEPFPEPVIAASAGKLQVAFLTAAPSAEALAAALAVATADDRITIRGTELYWLPSGGISDCELDLEALGAALGATTVRTMGTIRQLAAKHLAD